MTFLIFGLWQVKDTAFPYTWSYGNFATAIFCSLVCIAMVIWVIHLTLKNRHNI
jgi:hypothetical protein